MLSISHAATGALIATKIHNPLISIPLVIASHFLEDKFPHWDVGQGITKKHKSKKSAFIQELIFDFPASIIYVYFVFQHQLPLNYYVWLGWFFGLLPDFIEFPRLFLGLKHPLLEKFSQLHKKFHHSIPDVFWGLTPQILLLLVITLLA